jgi:hypothetical protein
MGRGMTAAQIAAVSGPNRVAVPLVEMLFDSGPVRLAYHPWNIVVGANTFIGIGALAELEQLRESAVSLEGFEFSISGLDTAALTIAAQEPYRGRIVRLYKAIIDPEAYGTVVGSPIPKFAGRIRNMIIIEENSKCDIGVKVEHYEAELYRSAPLRLNDADQQRLFPGDLGAQHAEVMIDREIVWPAKSFFKK